MQYLHIRLSISHVMTTQDTVVLQGDTIIPTFIVFVERNEKLATNLYQNLYGNFSQNFWN